MKLHYIKIAFRNLLRQKGLTFINIAGLSIGIACFSLFLLYAVNELNYDRFHTNKENIYQVYRNMEVNPGEYQGSAYLPIPLGPAMKHDFPDVMHFVRFRDPGQASLVRIGESVYNIPVTFADPEVFRVFTFPLNEGSINALSDPHSVVLSEQTASKLFPGCKATGNIIEIKTGERFEPFTVTGVCKSLPSNSTIQFEMICNFNYYVSNFAADRINEWRSSGYQTFVFLREGSHLPKNKAQLQKFYSRYLPQENSNSFYGLQPLQKVHTNVEIGGFNVTDPSNIWILLGIAFAILVIACINFTTLSIGRSAGRAKEVGIKKVIGGSRKGLIIQFLTESVTLSIFACLIGFGLGKLLLPVFNRLSEKTLDFSFTQFPELIVFLILIALVTGLVSGIYPALVLSGFNPVDALRKKMRLNGSNFFTRSLVTTQFVLSVSLIISTLIILKQLAYMRHKSPGFEKENVVLVNAVDADLKKFGPLFRQALLSQPAIKSVSAADMGLGEDMGWSLSSFGYEGKQKDIYEYRIDPYYLGTMDIPLLAGRNFDPEISSDTVNAVIINESLMRDFGWSLRNAVGQKLSGYSEDFTPVVIGVVKDFHFRPFKEKIAPQMFHQFRGYTSKMFFVRLQPGDPTMAITSISDTWKKLVPGIPVKYSFLSNDLDNFYKSEARWSKIIGWAGGISVFLSCLGLLGLAALSAVNRTKEIGIRKVLGASAISILKLLSFDFLKLVFIAIVIASPLSWYLMNKWLNSFAYRAEVGPAVFAVSALIALTTALFTVFLQSLKAARNNPVHSIRTE